jgi:ElaA protein
VSDVVWTSAPFDELSARDVHDLLRLRQDVFVIEQDCIFHEIDGRDPDAVHVLGRRDGRLVACARIFAPGAHYEEASIGRIATDPGVRGTGLGHELFRVCLEISERMAPGAPIRLAAQAHLERFYGAYGFVGVGDRYMDDGIVHLDMLRPAGAGAQGPTTAR